MMNQKKILLVITKGDIGGAQMSVFSLARELTRQGHSVTVISGEGEFLPSLLDKAHISHVRLVSLRRSYNPLHNLGFFFELQRYLNQHQFDAVHFNSSNTLFGAIAAKWSKYCPKTVFTFRGLSLLDETYTSSAIRQWLYRLVFNTLLHSVDVPVFVSHDNKKTSEKIGIARNGIVIYNGLDLEALKPLAADAAQKWCEEKIGQSLQGKYIIGSIGRLAYQKNYEFLIRMMPNILAKQPNAVCLIMGDGPSRAEYETLTKKHHLEQSVFLLGGVELGYQYASCFDVFVLPSRYEGMSITLIEMLAVGVPIITTNVGGNAEQLDGAGLIYKLDHEEQFLNHFFALAHDPKKREELSRQAQERAKMFAIENTANGYLKIY